MEEVNKKLYFKYTQKVKIQKHLFIYRCTKIYIEIVQEKLILTMAKMFLLGCLQVVFYLFLFLFLKTPEYFPCMLGIFLGLAFLQAIHPGLFMSRDLGLQ